MRPNKETPVNLQFQPRELALLRGLFESRVMTTAHATALYFNNKMDAANKRLQKLKSCGFIGERPRRAFQPSVLFLARKGIKQLETEGILHNYPSFALPALDRRARVSDLTIPPNPPAGGLASNPGGRGKRSQKRDTTCLD
jgi:hypothetical protein